MNILPLLIQYALCMYDRKSGVIEITKDNFNSQVEDNIKPVVLEFYAPWCGHCKQLAPIYESLAQSLDGIVEIAAIDCDAENNKQLCAKYNIKGFPTIKIFPSKLKTKGNKKPVDYNEERTKDAIKNFAIGYIPNTVKRITSDAKTDKEMTIEAFLESKVGKGVKVVLFSKKIDMPPLFKSLALQFNEIFSFGQVHNKEKEIVDQHSIDTFPTLMVIIPDNKDVVKVPYSGRFKFGKIKTFLDRFIDSKKFIESLKNVDLTVLVHQSEFEEQCINAYNTICALIFSNNNVNENHDQLVKQMIQVKKDFLIQDAPYKFFLLNPQSTPFILRQFEIEYQPSLLVLLPSKKSFALLDKDEGFEIVNKFLTGLLTGGKTQKYRFNPKLKKESKKEEKEEL